MDDELEFVTLLGQWTALQEQYVEIGEIAMVRQVQDMEEARMLHDQANRIVHTRTWKNREREQGHLQLMKYYFCDEPTYTTRDFRRRFRMQRSLFIHIMEDLQSDNKYFQQHPDTRGVPGFSSHQKITCALRKLAYGMAADATDEYLRIAETTAILTLKKFCEAVIKKYRREYLRRPTAADVQRLCEDNAARCIPGMLGSIDCMHWQWKSCPSAWQGQYIGHTGLHPTVILEAVADKDRWFWLANFGMPGSNNDLNVLHALNLFDEVLNGNAPECNFTINGRAYNIGYYLGDGIYPAIAPIVKAHKPPTNDSEAFFTLYQEAQRKDVERAFGMLHGRFIPVREPCRYLEPSVVENIMRTCVILNNMIVQDERQNNLPPVVFDNIDVMRVPLNMQNVADNYASVYSVPPHEQLRADLEAEIWNNRGGDDPIPPEEG